MSKSTKKQAKQPKLIEKFIHWCSDNSPFAVLGGIIFSFLICFMVDYSFFSIIFQNVFFGAIAIFAAFFIFVVRGALLFHSFNGFSTGKSGMGALSALLQIVAVIWVCYEAPKVAELLSVKVQVQQDSCINFIRFVACAATLLEILMILAIKDSMIEDEETEEDETEEVNHYPTPSRNGQGKQASALN